MAVRARHGEAVGVGSESPDDQQARHQAQQRKRADNTGVVAPLPYPAPKNQATALRRVGHEHIDPANCRHHPCNHSPPTPEDDACQPHSKKGQSEENVGHADSPLHLGQDSLNEIGRMLVILLEMEAECQVPVDERQRLSPSCHEKTEQHEEEGNPDSQRVAADDASHDNLLLPTQADGRSRLFEFDFDFFRRFEFETRDVLELLPGGGHVINLTHSRKLLK